MNNGKKIASAITEAIANGQTEEPWERLRKVAKDRDFTEEKKTLSALYDIFGNAVFIPTKIWGRPDAEGNFAAKGAPLCKYWPKLTYKESLSQPHQDMLCERLKGDSNKLGWIGNIAVLLGEPSENLVSIDIDNSEWIEPFLKDNPKFQNTAQVETYRGRQIFFRLVGDYPKTVCRLSVDRKAIGEFRGGKCFSIIYGHHPKSPLDNPVRYCPSSRTVITCRYEDIVWPDGWTVDDASRAAKKTRKSHKRYSLAGKPGSIDTESLREAIECDVEALCAELFVNGRMVGSDFRLADKEGNAPKGAGSLTVHTTGEYAGHWTDWATGEHGSFIDLVMSVYNTGFKEAVAKIEEALGQSFRVPDDVGNEQTPTPGPPKKPVLILPCANMTIKDSAKECFTGLAKLGTYFVRNGELVRIAESDDGPKLEVVLKTEFISQIEGPFELQKYYSTTKGPRLSPSRCSVENAQALLKTDEMRQWSLPLRLIAASPVIVERNGSPVVLQKGYHADSGGIYVAKNLAIPSMTTKEAVKLLTEGLFADYDWVSPSDLSRAVAQVISPALKLGNLLPGEDFPIDLALADQSQGGKTHRMKFTARIYGEHAYTVINKRGGVGSLDETLAAALCSGKLFVLFDNVRGDFDSQLLESVLRGTGSASVRLPYREEVTVRTDRVITQFTSNSANFTKDLANRSIITNNRKQADDYKPKLPWGEDFIRLIEIKQAAYLGAVHAVVREWMLKGKQRTNESRHDFRAWVQSTDWIVQNIFDLPAIMDGHVETKNRLSNTTLTWFREVVLTIVTKQAERLDIELLASDIRDICGTHSVSFPNARYDNITDNDVVNQYIGTLMSQVFKHSNEVDVEGHKAVRLSHYNPIRRKEDKSYKISARAQ